MAKTIDQRLTEVQNAIERVLQGDGSTPPGQTVEIRGRTVERPDLSTLQLEEKRLLKLKKRKERGGVRTRRGVPLDD